MTDGVIKSWQRFNINLLELKRSILRTCVTQVARTEPRCLLALSSTVKR